MRMKTVIERLYYYYFVKFLFAFLESTFDNADSNLFPCKLLKSVGDESQLKLSLSVLAGKHMSLLQHLLFSLLFCSCIHPFIPNHLVTYVWFFLKFNSS